MNVFVRRRELKSMRRVPNNQSGIPFGFPPVFYSVELADVK